MREEARNRDQGNKLAGGRFDAQVTLRELLEMVDRPDGGKLPTAKQLRELGEEVIATAEVGKCRIVVYRNGYFTYSDGSAITVQGVHRCLEGVRYAFQDGTGTTADIAVFVDEPFPVRLALEGERRLEHNRIRRKKDHEYSYNNMNAESIDLTDKTDYAADCINRLIWNDSLRTAMVGMTDRQKQVMKMYFFEDWTQQQIADIFGCRKQSVNECLQSVRKKIQKIADKI